MGLDSAMVPRTAPRNPAQPLPRRLVLGDLDGAGAVALSLRWPGRLAIALPIFGTLYVAFGAGYLEYYPFIAALYLASLAYLFFEPLESVEFFAEVTVDQEAGTLVWPNGVDFCPDVLYSEATGKPISELGTKLELA